MKNNKFLQGIVGLLAVALILFVAAKTRNTLAEYDYVGKAVRDRDTISIQGEGKVTAKPDLARLDLGVQTDAATVRDAQQRNTQRMNAIIAAVKEMGVAEKDIQTSGYSIYPKYQYDEGKQTIIGYTVSQNVTVKVRNLDTVGDVLARAGELGANQVGGIQFTIDEPASLRDEARLKAIQDARKKAEALASQLGLTILKVVTFSESTGGMPPVPVYAKAYEADLRSAAPAPDIQAGSLDVISNVVVTFEVR